MNADTGNSPPADHTLALLRRLTSAHHGVKVRGGTLVVSPRPPAEWGDEIRAHKPALLALVAARGGEVPPDPFPHQWPPVGWGWCGTSAAGAPAPGSPP